MFGYAKQKAANLSKNNSGMIGYQILFNENKIFELNIALGFLTTNNSGPKIELILVSY